MTADYFTSVTGTFDMGDHVLGHRAQQNAGEAGMAARADDDQARAQLVDEIVHHLALPADADMDLGRDAGLLGDLDRAARALWPSSR